MKWTLFYIVFLFLLINKIWAQQPELILPVGHTQTVNSAAISPDEKRIVTVSSDGKAKIWNSNGFELNTLRQIDRQAHGVEFTRDGKLFLVRYEKKIAVFQSSDGELVTYYDDIGDIRSAHFNRAGSKIFFTTAFRYATLDVETWTLINNSDVDDLITAQLGSDDSTVVSIWKEKGLHIKNVFTGESKNSFLIPGVEFTSVCVSPDGSRVGAGSDDGIVRIWNIQTGKLLQKLQGHNKPIISVCFNKNGTSILSAGEDEQLIVWNADTGDTLKVLKETENMSGAYFNPAGDKILAYSTWAVQVWAVSSGKQLYSLDMDRHLGSRYNGDGVGGSNIEYAAFSSSGSKVITASSDCTAKMWDAETGNFIQSFEGKVLEQTGQLYNQENNRLITGHVDGFVRFWDLVTGQLLQSVNKHDSYITKLTASKDGKILAVTSKNGQVSIWDIQAGKLLREWEGHRNWITDACFSPDNKKLLTASWDNTAAVWDVEKGARIFSLNKHMGFLNSAVFSSDGKWVATTSADSTLCIWRMSDGKLLHTVKAIEELRHGRISPDGSMVIASTSKGEINLWELTTGKPLHKFLTGLIIYELKFSADGKRIIALCSGNLNYSNDQPGLLAEYDIQSKKQVSSFEIPGESGSPTSVDMKPNGTEFLLAANQGDVFYIHRFNARQYIETTETGGTGDNTAFFTGNDQFAVSLDFGTRFYMLKRDTVTDLDVNPGEALEKIEIVGIEPQFNTTAIDSSDYVTFIPQGYYQCSPAAAKSLHYVTKDFKVITFEQLDVKYNRPDKVLEALGNTDTVLIKSYRKAWEKRIKRLGMDTTAFLEDYGVPEADFINRDNIEYAQKSGIVQLHIGAKDTTYKLDRFNIWVNEAPLYGQRGSNIRKANRNDLDTTITIQLSQGENRIETSITNVNGTESYRMPLIVNYTPAVKQKETTRFIGIGIDQFADKEYNLQYSSKDIRDLSIKLKEKYKDDIIIDTLFNKDVTVSNVKALKKKLQQTSENDKVIIAYSGHGLLSKEYDYYLSTYAINFDKPEQNGLPYEELENLLDSIPARKKLMFIDACHSGEVDKDDLIRLNASSDSLIKGVTPVAYEGEGHLGLKNSFELMQSLFVNVGKSTGATIISAAAGTQFALERNDLKNGVFTYSILEAMQKYPTLKISELKKIVGERVEEITKGLQKPTSRNETIAVDWSLW